MSRLELAKVRYDEADEACKAASVARDVCEAALLREELLAIADAHPEAVEFGYEAHWEYNDEGGYQWYVTPTARLEGDEDAVDAEELYGDHNDLYQAMDKLWRRSHEAWRRVTGGDNEYGDVTVEALRAA